VNQEPEIYTREQLREMRIHAEDRSRRTYMAGFTVGFCAGVVTVALAAVLVAMAIRWCAT
jgi:hypothetical protein